MKFKSPSVLSVQRKTGASVDDAKKQIRAFTAFLNLESRRLQAVKLPSKRQIKMVSKLTSSNVFQGGGTPPKMPGIKLPGWLGAVGWGAALFTFGSWGPKLFPGLVNSQERAIAQAPGTTEEKIAKLKEQKKGLNWFQKNVQGMGSEIDEQIYALETGDVKSYGYNMTPRNVEELDGKAIADKEKIRTAGKKKGIDVEKFEKTVDKFNRLAKSNVFNGGGNRRGPSRRQRTTDNSGDGVIEVGDIQPGGKLDFRGDGSGIGGKLVMHDGAGKKIGSWTATSGVYRTANSSQADRKNISGGYMPLPDGTYPLMGFDKHGPWPGLPGIGDWSAYINNSSGSIGARGGIMLHSDIGSNGTQGCIGVELGGRPGTSQEEAFLAAYEEADPTSVRVNIAPNANVPEEYESESSPTQTADNSEEKADKSTVKTTAKSTTELKPETREILSNAERRAKVVNKETGQTQGQVEDMQLRNQKIEAMRKALGRENLMQKFLDRQMGNTGDMAIENFSKMMKERGLGQRLEEINAMQHKNHVDESAVDTPDVESDTEDIEGVLEDTATVTSRRTENTVPEQYPSYNAPGLNSTVFNVQQVPPAMPPTGVGQVGGQGGGGGYMSEGGYSASEIMSKVLLVQLSGS